MNKDFFTQVPLTVTPHANPAPCAKEHAAFDKLTAQQYKVLTHLGDGMINKQIAFKLGITEATIKAHVSAVLRKLSVGSRKEAAEFYRKHRRR